MNPKVCKGCHTPIQRKRRRNGRLEHKIHYERKIYHDVHCKLLHTLERSAQRADG